ncbi:hypothetical protein H7B90_00475 [Cohnella xylanilytica]|uniref:Tail fiber-like repeat protein n=1 Tax=Cohnella xylanilytica TaxID=557555 RepID=A0A841TNZ9_9BACL|nr:pyocin knob domain-containing protein [Cohnella xylanilytica]MBB6689865.1 hypothetical protein [Cohnella xylanilytica]
MSIFTSIWNLLKKNPATDGNEMFNIETMLNDNWDKIDSALGMKGVNADVRAATIANIALSGLQTVDGVALAAGDRVLVKNQGVGSENGIYVVGSAGWGRASDADSAGKLAAGVFVHVKEGSANAGTGWILTTSGPIELGATPLTFAQKTGSGSATDTVIGPRTADPNTSVAYGLSGSVTQLFSWVFKYFKAITGKANPFDAPDMSLASVKAHVDATAPHSGHAVIGRKVNTSSGLQGGGDLSADRTISIAEGGVSDTHVGTRTIDDTVTATAGADTPTRLWSKLGNMIKAITGKSNWYTPPVTTIEALNANKLNASAVSTSDSFNSVAARDGNGYITARGFTSTNATGNAPFTVSSTTIVPNLNADMVDGYHGSDLALSSQWTAIGRCGTWSRILEIMESDITGHSFLLNISGTRSNVVFDTTLMINTSHYFRGNIVQLNNNSYSEFDIRAVINNNGGGYIEIFDVANNDGSSVLMRYSVSVTHLKKGPTITPITSFTDGTNIPSGLQLANQIHTKIGPTMVANGFIATAKQGDSPFAITSTTKVDNLNADMVDGFHADKHVTGDSAAVRLPNGDLNARVFGSTAKEGTAPFVVNSTTMVPKLNVEMVGGRRASDFVLQSIILGEGADLNNETAVGEYFCPANAWASTQSNLPPGVAEAYALKVTKHAGVNQTLTTYFHAQRALRMFTRNFYNGVWGAWIEILTTDNGVKKASVSNLGISSTAETTIASFFPPIDGNYDIKVYLRVSINANVSIKISYNDSNGPQITYLVNNQAMTVGSYSLLPVFLFAQKSSNQPVVISAKSSVANAVSVSASILEV